MAILRADFEPKQSLPIKKPAGIVAALFRGHFYEADEAAGQKMPQDCHIYSFPDPKFQTLRPAS